MGGNRKASPLPLLKNLDEYREKEFKVKIMFWGNVRELGDGYSQIGFGNLTYVLGVAGRQAYLAYTDILTIFP